MRSHSSKLDSVLFLSGIYPESWRDRLTDPTVNRNIQMAADVLQRRLIEGLEENLQQPVELLNAPYMGVFPRSAKIARIPAFDFAHTEGAKDHNIPFTNIPVWRHISVYLNSRKGIRNYVKEHPDGVVAAYALTLRNMYRLKYAKKKAPSVKTCLIVPDLPMYMRMSGNILYRTMKSIENALIKRRLRTVDAYVLLTEQMNEYVKAPSYCVVEGVAATGAWENTQPNDVPFVLYTGTLEEKYGVLRLAQAFQHIKDPAVRLYICGKGDAEAALLKASEADPRICLMGQVPHDQVLELQRRATVLVNPRPAGEEFTKYSFPSKNLEYLASGVPLVAYKLEGIPDEYDPYICYVKDDSVEALTQALESVLSLSPQERERMGKAAYTFVSSQKNGAVQTKKILDMLTAL